MKNPTMTLHDIQQALEAQDRRLLAARDEIMLEGSHRPVLVATAALERLREACAERRRPTGPTRSTTGIRC